MSDITWQFYKATKTIRTHKFIINNYFSVSLILFSTCNSKLTQPMFFNASNFANIFSAQS